MWRQRLATDATETGIRAGLTLAHARGMARWDNFATATRTNTGNGRASWGAGGDARSEMTVGAANATKGKFQWRRVEFRRCIWPKDGWGNPASAEYHVLPCNAGNAGDGWRGPRQRPNGGSAGKQHCRRKRDMWMVVVVVVVEESCTAGVSMTACCGRHAGGERKRNTERFLVEGIVRRGGRWRCGKPSRGGRPNRNGG